MNLPNDTVPVRELRHNLRTPINHILGYTEMLLEEMRVDELEQIRAAAREALSHINFTLGSRERISREELADLCRRVQASLERVPLWVESIEAPPAWAADLDRIRAAAESLPGLIVGAQPLAPEQPAEGPAPEVRLAVPGQGHLLVVDDNEPNRAMLRRRLEREGFAVSEAENGREALDLLRGGGFDLVLLDIMMPVMDGFEALARMKADASLRHLPVIVISALDEIKSAARCIEMGAEDYLFKPFDPVLLRARINSSLEKQRLRNELVVREKLSSLGALTAGVAHELKNPLNFVLNFAELSAELAGELRAKLDRPELADLAADLEQNVLKIKEHGARADSVIRSMLLHARGSGGERRPTDINRTVAEYVNLAYHGMRAENPTLQVRIESDYDPDAGTVDAVPQDISRVFLNLASNAFYAMRGRPGAVLRISTRGLGDRVEVRMRDNGPGIPQDIQSRIFDPFFTTKPAGEGTGLGLSLSHDIVTAEHKGEIRVESEPGHGAEFIVTLPRRTVP